MLSTIFQYLFPKRVIQGKMLSSHIDHQTGIQHTITYSPYAEYEYTTPDNALLVRFVNTYGFERVPLEHPFTSMDKKTLRQWNNDGLIPCVGEIYFINCSDEPKMVKPTRLTMFGETITFEDDIEVPPDKPYVTPPLISVSLNFSTELDVEFSFVYEGEEFDVKGIAQRLSIEEVNMKYASG